MSGEPTEVEAGTREAIRVAPFTRWLAARASVSPPLSFDLIEGGRSNLTFLVADSAGTRWILRRPPLHSVLASAHDVGREFRLMAALQDTPVPVPPLVGSEQDEGILGSPFYVMEYVAGLVPRDTEAVTAALDLHARGVLAASMADTLADLHAVDVDAVGLGDLARRSDYIARQLRRWSGQYASGARRDLPLVVQVHDRLATRIPEQRRSGLVHGDYRLDNLIINRDGSIRAVLDWELCTLGDPLADLGLLHVYWHTEMPMIPAAGSIPGMPPIDDVVATYVARSGLDVADLDYYVAFGYWRLAVILEGVYTRFESGAYGATDGSHEAFGELVIQLLDSAATAAGKIGR